MITIIHGNDIETSRNHFFEQKQNAKSFVLIDGENLLFSTFFQLIENSTLFSERPTLFIENFFTKNKLTEETKSITKYINENKKLDIVFWELTELTKTQQALLTNTQIKTFSFPRNIFLFLDNIKPANSKYLISLYKNLRKSTDDEVIFFMIIRQFRLMIGLLNNKGNNIDEVKKLASWQVSKLKNQLKFFDKDGIIKTYKKLFDTDLGVKTGKLPNSYEKSIDFLLASL